MAITTSDFIDVGSRAVELGLREPTGLVFLPRNFLEAQDKTDLVYEASVADLKVLFREAGLGFSKLEDEGTKQKTVKEDAFEWLLPPIFVTYMLYKSNPELFKLISGKIVEQSKRVFAAVVGKQNMKLDVVIEVDGTKRTKKVSFDGPPQEFHKLQEYLEKVMAEGEKKS